MKKVHPWRIVIILMLFHVGTAQHEQGSEIDSTLYKEVEDLVVRCNQWKSNEEVIDAVARLEEINTANPSQWLAAFWASHFSNQLAIRLRDASLVSRAFDNYEKAKKARYSIKDHTYDPYLYGLAYTLFYTKASFISDAAKASQYRILAVDKLNAGILSAPENQYLLILTATDLLRGNNGNRVSNYSNAIAAKKLLESVQNKFDAVKDKSPANLLFLHTNLITPYLNAIDGMFNLKTRRGSVTQFPVKELSEETQQFSWELLSEDERGDGANVNSADGKAFYYFHDKGEQKIWFKFELFNTISEDFPAVSIAFDIDNDQQTGQFWFGSNKAFKYDAMLSLGVLKRERDMATGYNGITNLEGITKNDWINEKQNVVDFYTYSKHNAYIIGISVRHLNLKNRSVKVMGSVGKNAIWNDDIGKEITIIL